MINPNAVMFWFYTPHTSVCPRFPDFVAYPAHYFDCVFGTVSWRLAGSLWGSGAKQVLSFQGLLLAIALIPTLLA